MNIAYPFGISGAGRTAEAGRDQHIRQMIEQVLFTMPGERVNRPDFGTGIRQYLFAGASDETLVATQFMIQGALQKWLGDMIEVDGIDVSGEDSNLSVSVRYRVLESQQRGSATFTT